MKLPIGDKLIVTNSVNCECICVGGITDVWRCPHIIAFLNSAIQNRFIIVVVKCIANLLPSRNIWNWFDYYCRKSRYYACC